MYCKQANASCMTALASKAAEQSQDGCQVPLDISKYALV